MLSIFWKSYALVKAGLFIKGALNGLNPGMGLVWYLLMAVGHIGLLAYAFDRALFVRTFWRLYFVLFALGLALIVAAVLFYARDLAGFLHPGPLLYLLLLLPYGYALWDYAFGQCGCWQRQCSSTEEEVQ